MREHCGNSCRGGYEEPRGDLLALGVLIAILAGCAVIASPLTALLAMFIVALLAIEFDRRGTLIAVRIVRLASLLPWSRGSGDLSPQDLGHLGHAPQQDRPR
jgi:hypothetical protein